MSLHSRIACECVGVCVGGEVRNVKLFFIYISSIDICQFSVSSLLNSSEDKSRSISFRSIILIMIYAGTIILNLLAASVDNKFSDKLMSSENSTITAAMEAVEKDNMVFIDEVNLLREI